MRLMSKAIQEVFENRENPIYSNERLIEQEAEFKSDLKADLIEEIESTGKTDAVEHDLIKVFADTLTEFAYGHSIGTLPDAEYQYVLERLKNFNNLTFFQAPVFNKQVQIDLDLVCSSAADRLMD